MNLMKPSCELTLEWPSRSKPGETGSLSFFSSSPCPQGANVTMASYYAVTAEMEQAAVGKCRCLQCRDEVPG